MSTKVERESKLRLAKAVVADDLSSIRESAMAEDVIALVAEVERFEDILGSMLTCDACSVRYDRANGGMCRCGTKRFHEARKRELELRAENERLKQSIKTFGNTEASDLNALKEIVLARIDALEHENERLRQLLEAKDAALAVFAARTNWTSGISFAKAFVWTGAGDPADYAQRERDRTVEKP